MGPGIPAYRPEAGRAGGDHVLLGERGTVARPLDRGDNLEAVGMDEKQYPLVIGRGFHICRDDRASPPGISPEELRRLLSNAERWRLTVWSGGGLTMSMNGMYPGDLERFLAGFPLD